MHNIDYLYVDIPLSAGESGEEGSIRLVGENSANGGHVEIYLLGHWGAVCSYNWDLLDATVACRQLGYPAAQAISTSTTYGLEKRVWLNGLYCSGYEDNITQCSHRIGGAGSCLYSRSAKVICSG